MHAYYFAWTLTHPDLTDPESLPIELKRLWDLMRVKRINRMTFNKCSFEVAFEAGLTRENVLRLKHIIGLDIVVEFLARPAWVFSFAA